MNRLKTFGTVSGIFLLISGFLFVTTGADCNRMKPTAVVSDSLQIAQLILLDNGKIPVEDFFKNPEKTSFSISPDGIYVAYLGPYETRLNIFVQKIEGDEQPLRVTSETERDITNYFWKNDNTLLFINDAGGDENFKLYAIDITGKNKKDLTPEKNVRIEIIDELHDFPDEVIIAMNKNNPALFEPYRLNIKTGEKKQLAQNKDIVNPVTIWKVDNNGKLRLAISVEKGTNTHLLYRATENEAFTSILVSDWKDMVEPLFFDENNKFIYALSNLNRDKAALVKIDPNNPENPEIIFEHPDVDVLYAERSPKKHKLISCYYATDKKHTVFFDDDLKEINKEIKEQFPGNDIYFNSIDDSEKNIIIRTYNDRTPGDFYLYNANSKKLKHLAEINPNIKKEQTCAMQAVSFKSRDSILINGYLTLPQGNINKNLPTVVLVHGGPMTRDYWGYRADVQLLASRGYAVFQINFRGSWGYGKDFALKGFKQWGKDMQNDITDGVIWLINQNIADANQVAIYGASYGGYAALAGVTFTPDLYVCAVDYVGPTNLFTLLHNLPSYWEPEKEMMYEMIGDPVKDSLMLMEASPVYHAAAIKVPLFIAQGGNDPRVNRSESEQMVDALRQRNIDVVYMVKENEGHGFKLEENRLDFYKTMMGFLALHMQANKPKP